MTMLDRDTLIRVALTPPADLRVPDGLANDISRVVRATPQRRARLRFGPLPWLPVPRPAAVLLLLLALLLIGVLFAIASRAPSHVPGLTMYHGGPGRTGVLDGPGPAARPVVAWKVTRHGGISFQIMPIVADGRVIVPDDSGAVSALDERTGADQWVVSVGAPVHSSPVVIEGSVIVGADNEAVTSLSATDGSMQWRFIAGGPVTGSLLAVDGALYVPSENGTLYVLDPATGTERWSVALGGPLTRGPAEAEGVIYIGAKGGQFSAIDATTHAVRWTRELGDGEIGTPSVAEGRVYVSRGLLAAAPPHDVVVLDARDGSTLWSFASATGEQVYFAAVGGGLAYAVSQDHSVYALDPTTGAIRWSFATGGPIGTLVSIVDGAIYVTGDDHMVRALDAQTGAQIWSVAVEGIPTMAAVIDGRVIVGTNLGKVIALGS